MSTFAPVDAWPAERVTSAAAWVHDLQMKIETSSLKMGIKEPLVSVALCTYNGERYIIELLDSLVQQSYDHIEIVVVDDGSTDRTYEILSKYKSRFENIRMYRNEKNIGFAKNFEKAIKLCVGDYIALCDQDDIWHLSKIECLVQNMNSNVLIYHDSRFIDQIGNPLDKKLSDVVNFYSGEEPEAFIFFNCISSHALMFRKALATHLFPFPEAGFHDAWIGYVACNLGRISYLEKPLVRYRQHRGSATDILKLKGHKLRPQKTRKYLANLSYINRCKGLGINKNPEIVSNLSHMYENRTKKIFSWPLFLFFIVNFERFFAIYKKGFWSKLNFAYKESRGIKLTKP